MVRIERTEMATELDYQGGTCLLTMERIEISLGSRGSRGGLGASYAHPKAIVRDGQVMPLLDLVMIVKLAGLLAVAVAAMIAEVRR